MSDATPPWSAIARADAEIGMRVEAAAMRLGTILRGTSQALLEDAWKEVARREQLFTDAALRSPSVSAHPRLGAIESVTEDLAAGRFV